ncbi:MAG: pyridoxamine 5-phosphate oxidase family protein [Agromyces sp.]|nr:pyridoxamine 5-phosphate oxidase family protein [Agromyces sp.]
MLQQLDCTANQYAGETSSVTTTDTTAAATTARRRIRRMPERQTADRDALFALLDGELVVLVHGSTGGGFALRAAAERATVAFAVTALDGLVYARSLFDSSMNYRSAVVYGVLEHVPAEETDAALLALSERLMPGRAAEVRGTTRKETAATRVLRLALDDVVMKVRAAGASEDLDDGEDHTTWAGVVPLVRTWGAPEASPLTPPGTPVPERRCEMFATMLVLGLLAASAIATALVQLRRDGYGRTPTVLH